MNNLEILFNLVIHPSYALRREDRTLSLAIMVIIAALWSSIAGDQLIKGVSVNAELFSFSIIISIIIMFFFIVINVSLWHFISEAFKGKGKASELFVCVCLCFLPFIFLAPMALVIKFLGINATFLWLFLNFLILLWVIILQISSIKIVYELSGSQAVLTYFIPFAAIFFIFFLVLMLLVIFIAVTASGVFMPLMEL